MLPLNLVTIHHEGAGDPTDAARGAAGGYTYWVGVTGFTRLRSPYQSFATLHFNHVSVDICLSGNRDNFDVTNEDLSRLSQIAVDARSRGELTNNPTVRPHRWTFKTDCPGTRAMSRWNEIAARFVGTDADTAAVAPKPHPVLHAGDWGPDVTLLQHELNVGTGTHLEEDGVFGPDTQQAVFGFQAFFHLTVDGIVGSRTWQFLDFCVARKLATVS